MDIDQWSQDSEAFKTISSDSQTRNQTSKKKKQKRVRSPSPIPQQLDPAQNLDHLYSRLRKLEDRRVIYIKASRYGKLDCMNNKIADLQATIKKVEADLAQSIYQEKQFVIYEEHEREMEYFHDIWADIFDKFHRNQQVKLLKLQVEEDREVRQLCDKLESRRQAIIRRASKNKELQQMRRVEQDLVKSKKFEILAKLQFPKKRRQIKKSLEQQSWQEINSIQQREFQKIQKKYQKKESCLKMKLRECREYQEDIFKKNRQKLKQKFMNSINNLQHSHKVMKTRCFSAK